MMIYGGFTRVYVGVFFAREVIFTKIMYFSCILFCVYDVGFLNTFEVDILLIFLRLLSKKNVFFLTNMSNYKII